MYIHLKYNENTKWTLVSKMFNEDICVIIEFDHIETQKKHNSS